jgi:hypothetical protein
MQFRTRGVVISVTDLTYEQWPEKAIESGLTTIGIHPFPEKALQETVSYMESDLGQVFLNTCLSLGLDVEYEIHAIEHLLPRDLYAKNPTMFRMNDAGDRVNDINFCPSSANALEIIAENTIKLCKKLCSTSGRYFLWGSDAYGWCKCPKCRELSSSDQALIMENRMLDALHTTDSCATLAHLAYSSTANPPQVIKPVDGIFLEYAPIHRNHDMPFSEQTECEENIENLKANLDFFGRKSAQILEYWLDVSLFSDWKRPAKEIRWNDEVFAADLETYSRLGIEHITTFACFLDKEYVAAYGDNHIERYSKGLCSY